MRITPKGNGRYHVAVSLYDKGKRQGRTYRRTFRGILTRAQLHVEIGAWVKSLDGSLTVGNVDKALRKYESLKPASVLANNASYRARLRKRLGGHLLDAALDGEWTRFVQELRAAGVSQGGINKYAAVMHAALRLYVGPDAKLPIRAWGMARVQPRDVCLDDGQQEMVLQMAFARGADYLIPILEYNFAVPSRRSELTGAKVADLDLLNNRFRVPVSRSKGGVSMWKPIPPHMETYFRTLPVDTEYIFFRRDEDGVCRPLGDFKRALRGVLKKADLLGVWRFHDGRHAAYTALMRNGTPKAVAQSIAGWRTDMARVYYHRDDESDLARVRWPQDDTGHSTETSAERGAANASR